MELRTGLPPWSHLNDLTSEEAFSRMTYQEVVACGHFSHLEECELEFISKCLTPNWKERPSMKELRFRGMYLTEGSTARRAAAKVAMKESFERGLQMFASL